MDPFGIFGKPAYKSFTAWGLVIFFGLTAAIDAACNGGLLGADTCGALSKGAEAVGAVLTTLGIRRASTQAR